MSIELREISGHTFISNDLTANSTVLDLGANAGLFASTVNGLWGCNVHAVEPTPALADKLRKISGLIVHEFAVSSQGKDLYFSIDPLNSEASCLAAEVNDKNTLVRGTTLADLLLTIGSVDLLKIDVEGAEIEILNNTPELLLSKIPQISVEFHDFKADSGVTNKMVRDTFNRMRSFGFLVNINSFWTNGDVLFINRKLVKTTLFDRLTLSLRARWLPGIKRVLSRLVK